MKTELAEMQQQMASSSLGSAKKQVEQEEQAAARHDNEAVVEAAECNHTCTAAASAHTPRLLVTGSSIHKELQHSDAGANKSCQYELGSSPAQRRNTF